MSDGKMEFELCLYHETEKAWLVAETEGARDSEKFWIPKSKVKQTSEHQLNLHSYGVFEIPEWLAKMKGLL